MKVFRKFLAVILALVTVLTLIPFSVFAKEASEPWLEVEGSEGTDAPVVTIKLDAAALMALLRADDASSPILTALRSGIAVDFESLTQVFSVQELFEIIPKSEWIKIIPIETIVEKVGLDTLKDYVDLEKLAEQLDDEDIEALLAEIEDISVVIDLSEAIKNIDKVIEWAKAQVKEIAELKMPDLNAASLEAAMSMVAGTARSMGVTVEE